MLKKKYTQVTSGESFSYFIHRAYELLKENGILSFILPEAILNVKTHKDIRKFILDNTNIVSIYFHNKLFKKVFTGVIRLDFKKTFQNRAGETHQIKIFDSFKTYKYPQGKLYKNPDFIFSFHPNGHSEKILEKAYALEYTTLKNQADWALGIVTGDNRKFLSSSKDDDYEEVFTGREVDKFQLKTARNYIKFAPELFQQTAPIERYRAKEKLIYKFISSSLVMAYDNKKRLTLNSANILIPKIPGYPIKTIMALFNSSLYQFIFQRKFNSIKVLRNHLEALPLPVWDQKIHSKISVYIKDIMKDRTGIDQLNNYIFRLFGLTSDEIEYVKRSLKR